MVARKHFLKLSGFLIILVKIKYRSSLAENFDFCVTGRRMISYTGN